MTTGLDLRDLLTTEADGPTRPAAGWDDIVRRGQRHRRAGRARRSAALAALAAVVAIGGFALLENGAGEDRDDVIVDDPDTTVKAPPGFGPWISEVQEGEGAHITVLTGPADQARGWDPCAGYRPKTTETDDQVVVTLVGPRDPDAGEWVRCESTPDGTSGTVELEAPLGRRHVIDGYNEMEIWTTFTSAAPVLAPTDLPEPLDPTRPVQDPATGADASAPWTLEYDGGGLAFEISTSPFADSDAPCPGPRGAASGGFYAPSHSHDVEVVAVRGTRGDVCSPAAGVYYLSFWEHGQVYFIRLAGPAAPIGGVVPFTQDDIIAIAEGLEPLRE